MTTGHATRRKLATALRAYLASLTDTALAGFTMVRGIRSGLVTLPSVAVHVSATSPAFADDESVVWALECNVLVRTAAVFEDGSCEASEDAHDAAAEAVEAALTSDRTRAFVNSENTTVATAATAGTFTIADTAEEQTTASLAYDISAGALQAAIRAALGEMDLLTVTGANGGPFTLDMGKNQPYPYLTAAASLSPAGALPQLHVIRVGTASLSPRWLLSLGVPLREVTDFHLDPFRNPTITHGYDAAEGGLFWTLLRYEFSAMSDDGDEERTPGMF